jgi:hypothetical protein
MMRTRTRGAKEPCVACGQVTQALYTPSPPRKTSKWVPACWDCGSRPVVMQVAINKLKAAA